MFDEIVGGINHLLGLDVGPADAQFWQLMLRAVIMYTVALILIRMGRSRLFGKNAAFDVILGVILGSVMSRGINGVAPFFGTMALGAALIGLHWLLGYLSYRLDLLGKLVKGIPTELVRNGEIHWERMRENGISAADLQAAMRQQGQTEDLQEVACATLENTGNISIIRQPPKPQILEIAVREGVQQVTVVLK